MRDTAGQQADRLEGLDTPLLLILTLLSGDVTQHHYCPDHLAVWRANGSISCGHGTFTAVSRHQHPHVGAVSDNSPA